MLLVDDSIIAAQPTMVKIVAMAPARQREDRHRVLHSRITSPNVYGIDVPDPLGTPPAAMARVQMVARIVLAQGRPQDDRQPERHALSDINQPYPIPIAAFVMAGTDPSDIDDAHISITQGKKRPAERR